MFHLKEKQRIIASLIALNVSLVLLQSSLNLITILQPIYFNRDDKHGIYSQLVLYSSQILASLIWPQLLINYFGFKFLLVFAQCVTCIHLVMLLYPQWYPLYSACFFTGLGVGLFWTIFHIYINDLALRYSLAFCTNLKRTVVSLYTVTASIYYISFIVSEVLMEFTFTLDRRESVDSNQTCGFRDCAEPFHDREVSISKPDTSISYASFAAICLLSVLITLLFLNDVKTVSAEKKETGRCPMSLMNPFESSKLWLYFPFSFLAGYEFTFIFYEFNQAFVICLHGLSSLRYQIIILGGMASFVSILLGLFHKRIDLLKWMIIALLVSSCQIMFIHARGLTSKLLLIPLNLSFALLQSLTSNLIRERVSTKVGDSNFALSSLMLFQSVGQLAGVVVSGFTSITTKYNMYVVNTMLTLLFYVIAWLRMAARRENEIYSLP